MKTNVMKLIVSFFILSSSLFAINDYSLEIADNHQVYYKYEEAQEGKPTIVMLNGLIYSLDYWDDYLEELVKEGYGVVLIAYSTQPESLALLDETPFFSLPVFTPYGPSQANLETEDLVEEVMSVVDSLDLDRFNLLSLSYGSIVAVNVAMEYKDRIDNFIMTSPAVMPSNRYFPLGESRYQYYFTLRQTSPFPGQADYLYDVEFFSTLATTVTPFVYSFDDVDFPDFFNGVYQMVRSAKWFDLKDYAGDDFPPTYLFLASDEESELKKDQFLFWSLFNTNDARKSLVIFRDSPHAIVGASPIKAAEMTIRAINGKLVEKKYNVDAD